MDEIKLKVTDTVKHFRTVPQTAEIKHYTDEQKLKIGKAAKDFETLLTSMMIKSMKESGGGGLFGEEGLGGEYFDSIFENAIAEKMSGGNGMGVAELLYRKITGEEYKNISTMKNMPEVEQIKVKITDRHAPPLEPSRQSVSRLSRFENIINEASEKFGVDKNIIKSVILTESAGNEKAVSTAKAKGLMQLIDSTAKDMGVNNVWDPKENIFGGTKYLSQMLKDHNGDLKLALASYNAGPGNVEKYKGVPPFEETQNYVVRVMGYLKHFEGM